MVSPGYLRLHIIKGSGIPTIVLLYIYFPHFIYPETSDGLLLYHLILEKMEKEKVTWLDHTGNIRKLQIQHAKLDQSLNSFLLH